MDYAGGIIKMKQLDIKKEQGDRLKKHLIRELEIDKSILTFRYKKTREDIDKKIGELNK
jgi:hypothetical protein